MITISNSRFDGEADDTTTRWDALFRMLRAVESNKTKTKEWRSDAVEGDKRRRKSHIFQLINKLRDHRAIGHIKSLFRSAVLLSLPRPAQCNYRVCLPPRICYFSACFFPTFTHKAHKHTHTHRIGPMKTRNKEEASTAAKFFIQQFQKLLRDSNNNIEKNI